MTQPAPEFLDLQAALAGEYSLQRELGRGGMGIVYLARDVQLDRDVAIKVLPAPMARTAESRERFVREARTAAGLSHPNIVPIHRVGEAGGFVFFVMSYVEGETLGERLRESGPLPPADAMRVMREVAWAIAYAHGRGIVHRDIKPDNILLEAGTGRALVTDFGIAHGGDDARPVTDPGKIMGTAHYMSPEQAASAPVDGRSDIYSLGVVGYLAVSGRLPFDSNNLHASMVRQATEAPPSVMRAAPGLPPALGSAIDRCLARDPAGRFSDGEALAAALAPTVDARPALPPSLRAWLGSSNPAAPIYIAASGLFTVMLIGNVAHTISYGNLWTFKQQLDVALLATLATLPLVPSVGYHLNQARRLFRAGHSLADLRSALDIAARERSEGEALAAQERETPLGRILRTAFYGMASWFAVTFYLAITASIPNGLSPWRFLAPLISTAVLGAVCNVLEIQMIPDVVRNQIKPGLRERLWRTSLGKWLARRLDAPEQSRLAGASAFRATEAALGVAAAELFDALPKSYREQLAELPATVVALEAQAAAARAEIDVIAALAPSGSVDADALEARRANASRHLAVSVAALEGIRLDLLRLHAGAGDLAPLTTLMDAARLLGEDVNRLADARREVDDVAPPRRIGAHRVPTPA
ncbi:MAG: serine/threonine protein kinase [Gemmatimonadota bacterium]|nr:serine/threonine protein kinase [Gemmatimonadota bacterium]